MTKKEFFATVPARQFFPRYAPGVKNYYHKCRGFDGNKRPIDFTEDDRRLIREGQKKLAADIKAAKV